MMAKRLRRLMADGKWRMNEIGDFEFELGFLRLGEDFLCNRLGA